MLKFPRTSHQSNTSFNEVLVFRTQHRFKENDSHRVVFELDQPSHTPIRYVCINWLIWDANCGGNCGAASGILEELMIYGRGFPREVRFGSGLIDLGDDKNVTALRWDADTPPGTAVEIRSRSGNST